MSNDLFSRKEFLKKLWWILLLPYVLMMALMTRRHKSVSAIREFRINNILPQGISFHGDVVCIKDNSNVKFFHSRCTHLGCMINKAEGGKLVCPCHGSEFNLKGEPLKGPANTSLKELNYSKDENNNEFIIRLS